MLSLLSSPVSSRAKAVSFVGPAPAPIRVACTTTTPAATKPAASASRPYRAKSPWPEQRCLGFHATAVEAAVEYAKFVEEHPTIEVDALTVDSVRMTSEEAASAVVVEAVAIRSRRRKAV